MTSLTNTLPLSHKSLYALTPKSIYCQSKRMEWGSQWNTDDFSGCCSVSRLIAWLTVPPADILAQLCQMIGRNDSSSLRKWSFSSQPHLSLCPLPTPSAFHCLSTLINMSDRKPDNSQGLVQLVGMTSFKMSGLNKLYLHYFGLQFLKDFHLPHRRNES